MLYCMMMYNISRNTNAVLYDDVDENQIVQFDGNPPLQVSSMPQYVWKFK